MNPLLKRRQILMLLATSAVVLLTILAAGLSDIRLAPPQPLNFGGGEVRPIEQTIAEIAKAFSATPLWQQTLLLAIVVLSITLAIIFLPPDMRKRLFRTLFRMSLMIFALLYFFNNFELGENFAMPEEMITSVNEMDPAEPTIVEPEIFEPQEVSPVWSYVISLIILGASGVGIWYVWRIWSRIQQPDAPLKEFSRIARASLNDLDDGADWEDVIVRSYVQMGAVVKERRGIERTEEMTPHEFASRLVDAGLPPAPVEQLTRLFEFVRYSQHTAGEEQMAEAVTCLNEIADAFGEKLR